MINKFKLVVLLGQYSDEQLKRSPKLITGALSILNRAGYDNKIDEYIKKRLTIFPNLTISKKVTKHDLLLLNPSKLNLLIDDSKRFCFTEQIIEIFEIHDFTTLGELRHYSVQELLDLGIQKKIVSEINDFINTQGYCLYGSKIK
jgi:hypothetical protein